MTGILLLVLTPMESGMGLLTLRLMGPSFSIGKDAALYNVIYCPLSRA